MATEDEIIRKRLLVDGDGVSNDDRRINSIVKTFVKWCNSKDGDEDDSDSEHQKMLFSLEQCEFSFAKTQMIMDMNQLELKRYKKINADIEQSIKDCEANISTAREDLKEAKDIRHHRQQYDALARVIQEHPERQKTEMELTQLQEQQAQLKKKKDALISKFELRRREFHILLHSVNELQQMIQRESDQIETEENGQSMETS